MEEVAEAVTTSLSHLSTHSLPLESSISDGNPQVGSRSGP